jgi:hypothetical protein
MFRQFPTSQQPLKTSRQSQKTSQQSQQTQQTQQPQQPLKTSRQLQRPLKTSQRLQQPLKSTSNNYEEYVINNINIINKVLRESANKFNNDVNLLINIKNIEDIESIKYNINNLQDNFLNYLGIINSLDKFSVSYDTQVKIIQLQEKIHDFLNKLRDILYAINNIELDNINNNNYIDSVINDTYNIIIHLHQYDKNDNNIKSYRDIINRLLKNYNFSFNNNNERLKILEKFLEILTEFRKTNSRQIVYMGGTKRPK